MSAIGSATRPANGFTLIEMLVVLAIAGLIAGIGWPRLQGNMAAAELRRGVGAVVAGLRSARALATLRGVEVDLVGAPAVNGFRIAGAAPVVLPASVRMTLDQPVHFFADGSSSGGTVLVRGHGTAQRIDVQPTTGLVRVAAS